MHLLRDNKYISLCAWQVKNENVTLTMYMSWDKLRSCLNKNLAMLFLQIGPLVFVDRKWIQRWCSQDSRRSTGRCGEVLSSRGRSVAQKSEWGHCISLLFIECYVDFILSIEFHAFINSLLRSLNSWPQRIGTLVWRLEKQFRPLSRTSLLRI